MFYQLNYAEHEEHFKMARRFGLKVGKEKPTLNLDTCDVYEALSFFKNRENEMIKFSGVGGKAGATDIESWLRTFSTFDGTTKQFLRLYLLAEDMLTPKKEDE